MSLQSFSQFTARLASTSVASSVPRCIASTVSRQRLIPQFSQASSSLNLVRNKSTATPTPDLVDRVARNAIKAALRKNPGVELDAESVESALADALVQESENVRWVQDLLDTTEGGGYIVSEAGLLSHNIFWGDMVSNIKCSLAQTYLFILLFVLI